MPFCTNCGAEVGENEKFCSNCGNPLQEDQKAVKKTTVKTSTPKVITSSRKTNKLIWVIVPVIVVVAAAYFLWPSNNIEFVDKNLEEAVRLAIGKTDGDIKKEDVEGLVELDAAGKSIESIEGIEQLTSLQILNLSDNKITDISPLGELTNLQELYIESNEFDISDNSLARKIISQLKENRTKVKWIITFTKTFGGNDDDRIFSVLETKDGGYILAGTTKSYGSGNIEGWLMKIDEKGKEEWSKTFGGNDDDGIFSVLGTKDGGYILAGYTKSNGSGGQDGWLIKTDEKGKEEWSQTYGGKNNDGVFLVQQTKDGGYILAGFTDPNGSSGLPDARVIKTDEKGREEWSKTFGGDGYDWISSIQQTKDGGYILAGRTSSYGSEGSNGWLIKTDEKGREEWSKTFGGNDYDGFTTVQQTKDGGYILSGVLATDGAGNDGWLIKTDDKGKEEWSKTFGSDNEDWIRSIQQTKDGGYILAGYMNVNKLYGEGDIWLTKTDEKGKEEWSQTYRNGGHSISVQQTKDGGYILAGPTKSYDSEDSNAWLIKTDENGNVSDQQ